MMKHRWLLLLGALAAVGMFCMPAHADLVVPGDFQDEIGAGADWSLPDAPTMNDNGGGLFDISLFPLGADTRYQFKIVNKEPAPVAWGNGEVPDNGPGSPNSWLQSSGAGTAVINLDRNVYADGFLPATDRITVSTDSGLGPFYATGDWQTEAGGAGNFDPADLLHQMSDQGGGLWSLTTTVATPGSYLYKATAGSFDFQWGTNGRLGDAANWEFSTIVPNQEVTFLLDVGQGAISLQTIPEPATIALLTCLGGCSALGLRRRR